ncbi:putative DNA helicase [Alloactinosynnema sp. L-07]|uniref:3'-5' exonuclease n=1 Tax=Alloactinosynnema sp. L-07 TaxID=1653480 RepID=UPI00065EFFBC|nr:3'-5' exonuclease [Alloactinosynnema sp. L-07]CRK57480.1 putative DNA helicase [Alloactinosynnema sp. L-07]
MTPDLSVIGVLARTNRQCDDLARALRQAGISVETLGKDFDVTGDGVRVATIHRAKGTEFARVIVARLSDGSVPEHWILEQSSEGDHVDILQRERLFLYVAATRARDHLMLTWSGTPSRFLPEEVWGDGAEQGPRSPCAHLAWRPVPVSPRVVRVRACPADHGGRYPRPLGPWPHRGNGHGQPVRDRPRGTPRNQADHGSHPP